MYFSLSGLIVELDAHKFDYATKHLASHATYILVQKQLVVSDTDSVDGHSTPGLTQYGYVPLLDKYSDHFPNYKLHVAEVEKKKTKRSMSKSPSPAGKFTSKTKKNLHAGKASARRK